MDFTALRRGQPGTSIGGQVAVRIIEAVLTLDNVAQPLTLTILEPTAPPATGAAWREEEIKQSAQSHRERLKCAGASASRRSCSFPVEP